MDTYLYDVANEHNCYITQNKTKASKSFVMETDDMYYINIDVSRIKTSAEKKVYLAHELGHCISGTTYTINHSKLYRGSAEYKADYRAAQLLMPINDLRDCICKGITERYDLAEYFNVTEKFVERALYIYGNKGLLENLEFTL
ncbi:MAG: ImmA/IrrE family metallo-endopeptidase [Anaerorhabdus sp.]|uniref:ImmA/IrrE family metallo-endopeptidase n=1 Tax=Anaerorhabdus sp. TaxID=1872524 RepID=UPI003A8B8D97